VHAVQILFSQASTTPGTAAGRVLQNQYFWQTAPIKNIFFIIWLSIVAQFLRKKREG